MTVALGTVATLKMLVPDVKSRVSIRSCVVVPLKTTCTLITGYFALCFIDTTANSVWVISYSSDHHSVVVMFVYWCNKLQSVRVVYLVFMMLDSLSVITCRLCVVFHMEWDNIFIFTWSCTYIWILNCSKDFYSKLRVRLDGKSGQSIFLKDCSAVWN